MSEPAVNPAAAESCNLVDDNCDGIIDEGFDQDMDGFSSCAGDCDDSDPAVNPAATEGPVGDPTCSDSADNDCDGSTDASDSECQ